MRRRPYNGRMRIVASLLIALVLAGCPGSTMEPLPPGAGPGDYVGQFVSDEDDSVVGTFELTISNVGQVEGFGLLEGRSIAITGTFAAGELDGLVTDTLTQLSGRFRGTLIGSVLAGDFRLPRLDDRDLTGLWDAAPR